MSKIIKVKLLKSNEIVSVYKSILRESWVDYSDCNTEYSIDDIETMMSNNKRVIVKY